MTTLLQDFTEGADLGALVERLFDDDDSQLVQPLIEGLGKHGGKSNDEVDIYEAMALGIASNDFPEDEDDAESKKSE